MGHKVSIILLILLAVLSGCERENSLHPLVDLKYKSSSVDEAYVGYLLAQIEDHPEVSDNYVKLSDIYAKQGNNNAAIRLLQKGARASGGNSVVLLTLGKHYLQNGNMEELSVILRSLRNSDPDNIDFLKLSAGYAFLLKDAENALFFANRALLVNPVDDENFYLLANGQLLNKDSINALNTLGEAYRLRNSYQNFSKVFDLALQLRQPDLAREYLHDFESINKNVNCCFQWGALYNTTGKRDSARWMLRNCEEPGVARELVSYEIAKSFYPEQVDSVLLHTDEALSLQPRYLQALVLKAKLLDRQGNLEQARSFYESAIQIDSTYTIALQGLDNLERKVAYLRLVKRKENVQRDLELFKPLNSKKIN